MRHLSRFAENLGDDAVPRRTQRISLCLAAAFSQDLGGVLKKDCVPEP
jgi:hypothetical protein